MKSLKPVEVLCWATPSYSSWEVSNALSGLNVSHTVRISSTLAHEKINLGFPQPRAVHVTDRVKDLVVGSVNFISGSYAELSSTNIPRFPEPGQYELPTALKMMLESTRGSFILRVNSLSALDYVAMVSRPSLLNSIQTLIYKIQPYSLRKDVQDLVLRYFTGQISKTSTKNFLKNSLRTTGLIPLIEGGDALRDAVMRAKHEDVEVVAAETGIAVFDLTYLGKERVIKALPVKAKAAKAAMPNSMRQAISTDRKVVKF